MLLVKSIMGRRVVTVRRTETVKNAVKKMVDKRISCVVVVKKREPIGIFTKRDLLDILKSDADLNKTTVESVMRTPVMAIEENESFITASRYMSRMEVRRFVTVDADGRLSGIVTQTDIVKSFASQMFPYNLTLASVAAPGVTATPNTPLRKIVRMMIESRYPCVTILKSKKPVGIVDEQLIAKLASRFRHPLKAKAGEKMNKKIMSEHSQNSLRKAVLSMTHNDCHNLVLVDDRGYYEGIVGQNELVGFIERSQL